MIKCIKYFTIFCVIIFFIGCNSHRSGIDRGDAEYQIVLADSILLYFQQEQFENIVYHFDDKIKLQLNKEQLAVVWAQLNSQFGKYEKNEFYEVKKMNNLGYKVVYICFFGSYKLYFQLVLGKENRVIGMFFKPQYS